MWKTAKILALTTIIAAVTGCQLLIDNRSRESGAVVVVPSEEWEAMRKASLAASRVTKLPETDDMGTETPVVKIEPTPGSEAITFSNYTSSNLGGCIATGILEVRHRGTKNDAITLLKNEAFRLNGSALIVTKMNSNQTNDSNTIKIEARLLACPIRMAKGN